MGLQSNIEARCILTETARKIRREIGNDLAEHEMGPGRQLRGLPEEFQAGQIRLREPMARQLMAPSDRKAGIDRRLRDWPLPHRGHDLLRALTDPFERYAFLTVEIPKEGALRHVDRIHDLADSCISKAIFRKEIESCPVECATRFELLAFSTTHGLSGSGVWADGCGPHDGTLPKFRTK